MRDVSWINNPAFKDIDAKKLAILVELMNNSEGKKMQDLIPVIMSANSKLNSMGLKFSNDETNLMMDLLTKDMSEDEKQKVNKMKTMISAMQKK